MLRGVSESVRKVASASHATVSASHRAFSAETSVAVFDVGRTPSSPSWEPSQAAHPQQIDRLSASSNSRGYPSGFGGLSANLTLKSVIDQQRTLFRFAKHKGPRSRPVTPPTSAPLVAFVPCLYSRAAIAKATVYLFPRFACRTF